MADEMDNEWGCRLVIEGRGGGQKSFQEMDRLVRSTVPDYQLVKLTGSGTEANQAAIDGATGRNLSSLLCGMGCYIGGDEVLQPYSTSTCAGKTLAFPGEPSKVCNKAREHCIPLPYLIDCKKYNEADLRYHEKKCLGAIHKRLLVAMLNGHPYKALIMEYILGGNGGSLSRNFLTDLGTLLQKFGVSVVCDEIMTAGRVGPSMTMTSDAPKSFQKCVKYITVGKFTGCGLVLKRAPKRPVALEVQTRGSSTSIEAGGPYGLWKKVSGMGVLGAIALRRSAVLEKFDFLEDSEDHWGQGCLIFTTYQRPSLIKGVKNRLLPMIEPQMKLRKLKCTRTDWNRSSVCDVLISTANLWITEMENIDKRKSPFTCALVEYISDCKATELKFTDNELLHYIGEMRGEKMAQAQRDSVVQEWEARSGKARWKCSKSPLTFVKETTKLAASNSPESAGCRGCIKKRLGKKRIETNIVHRKLLGFD